MPVDSAKIEVSPYTTTVPMVQVPPEQMEASSRPAPPLQGNFTGKHGGATSGLAIGDALFKGFLAGHQQKEQKKYAQAQATITAADAGTDAAYQKYQESLSASGGRTDAPEAKAAYDAYLQAFNQGKAAKAQFVIPEKGSKGKKGSSPLSTDTDPAKSPDKKKGGGFMGGIKEFMEANPHIVPQIALMTMQPKPQGLSAEGQIQQESLRQQKTANDEAERKSKNEKIYQDGVGTYGSLTQEEVEKLPAEEREKYNTWAGAKAALTPLKPGTMYIYRTKEGKLVRMTPEDAYYNGAELYSASAEGKPGTVADFLNTISRDNKMEATNLNAQQKGYLEQLWHFYQANPNASTSTSWYVDDKGNWQPRTAPGYRGQVPPAPPPGVFPPNFKWPGPGKPEEDQKGGPQKVTKPPKAPNASTQAAGKVSPPPSAPAGKPSWQRTQNTERVQKQQKDMYEKAEAKFTAARKTAEAAFQKTGDRVEFDRRIGEAQLDLDQEKKQVESWYATQVHNVGGNVPSDNFNWQSFPVAQ